MAPMLVYTRLSASIIPSARAAAEAKGDAAEEVEGCKLMADWRGYVVQFLLAVIGLSSLLVKRHFERPRRQFNIWILDVLKQAFSGGCAHAMGMLNAIILDRIEGAGSGGGDECSWYFIAFGLDTTFGVGLAYVGIQLVERLALRYGWLSLQETGWYGDPGPDRTIWAKQMLAWCIIVITARTVVLGLMVASQGWLSVVSGALASPFKGEPTLFLVLVMIGCPLGMNVVQLWIQDTFLKRKDGWGMILPVETGRET